MAEAVIRDSLSSLCWLADAQGEESTKLAELGERSLQYFGTAAVHAMTLEGFGQIWPKRRRKTAWPIVHAQTGSMSW